MTGTSKNVMSHMALGSGTTAAAAGQTDLVSILGSREALDSSTPSTNTVVYVSSLKQEKALVRLQRQAYSMQAVVVTCFVVQFSL